MSIYNAGLQNIDINEVRRYAGMKPGSSFPDNLLAEACLEAQALSLPRGIWQIYEYDNLQGSILAPKPLMLSGTKIIKHLASAEKVAIMAVTIGSELEHTVSSHFNHGNYSAGFLLDAAGTTAVESVADTVNALITQEAARAGYITLSRFSPGYGDWDIIVQPKILDLAQGNAINISVTPSCMLLPRKSVTAIIGFAPNNAVQKTLSECEKPSCSECTQLNCLARKEQQLS